MARQQRNRSVTIAASGTQSAAINAAGMAFGSIEVPAAISGSTYSIEARPDESGTWKGITDSQGNAVTVALTASKLVRLPDTAFPCKQMRLVSDTTEAAERIFTVYLEE